MPGWGDDDYKAALDTFFESCRAVKQPHWRTACRQARALTNGNSAAASDKLEARAVREFFETHFRPWQVVNGDGTVEGLITGYYEPLLTGSRERSDDFKYPVLGVPEDLLQIDLSEVYPELKDRRLRGRIEGRRVVPYFARSELISREDKLPARPLFWVADPIDLFFLQVQGSGRIALPDGSRARVGYADQNGHPYQSIGRWLVERGELTTERASMEGIKSWVRDNPSRLDELLNANPSYVFFRELPNPAPGSNDGPIGAMGVPLTPERSIAVDPRIINLGAPVWLASTQPNGGPQLRRLMVAQDTGGAIKGGVRADYFWGFGAQAGGEAGRMRQRGSLWVLLPREYSPN
jgi:membrane-bound lytic murein transglycosylase A